MILLEDIKDTTLKCTFLELRTGRGFHGGDVFNTSWLVTGSGGIDHVYL